MDDEKATVMSDVMITEGQTIYDGINGPPVSRIRWGLNFLAAYLSISLFYPIIILLLTCFANPFFHDVLFTIQSILSVATMLVFSFLLTLKKPDIQTSTKSPAHINLPKIIRLSSLIVALITFTQLFVCWFVWPGDLILSLDAFHDMFRHADQTAVIAASAVCLIGSMVLLQRLARQIADMTLMIQLQKIITIISIASILLLIAYPAGILVTIILPVYNASSSIEYLGHTVLKLIYLFALLVIIAIFNRIREGQAASTTETEQSFVTLNRQFIAGTRIGLNLIKWSLILMSLGILSLVQQLVAAGNGFMVVLDGLVILLSIIMFCAGFVRMTNRSSDFPKSVIKTDFSPILALSLGGVGAGLSLISILLMILLTTTIFGEVLNDDGTGRVVMNVISLCFMLGMLSCIAGIIGFIKHLQWLSEMIGCNVLIKRFRLLVIASGWIGGLLFIIILAQVVQPGWTSETIRLIGLNLFGHGKGILDVNVIYSLPVILATNIWAMILVDQLWREFNRAHLVMGK